MSNFPIWAVAPHLCGFTEAVARRRLLLPFTVFCDESGKSEPPVFVMAGFMAPAEQWGKFNEEWQAVLDEEPPIKSFHMAEAKRLGYYNRFPRLVKIIKKYVVMGFAVSVRHDEYKEIVSGKIAKRMNNPYFMMFQSIMGLAAFWQVDNGINDKMDFIFDEQMDQSDYLQSVYSKVIAATTPEVRERMGGRPIHANDEKMLPLQAADILAWSVRRSNQSLSEGREIDSDIEDFFDNLPFSAQHFSRRYLEGIVDGINETNRKNLMLTEVQALRYLPIRDIAIMKFNVGQIQKSKEGDTILLMSYPAKQSKRFLLVRSCPLCNNPHLHKRAGGECLGEARGGP